MSAWIPMYTLAHNYYVMYIYFVSQKVKHITFLYTDVDECGVDPCVDNAVCTNTPGKFACRCGPGYEGDQSMCTGMYVCVHALSVSIHAFS